MKSHLPEILSAALGVAVMCAPAHAKAPSGRYVVGVDPTGVNPGFPVVFDTKTKLTWQRGFTGPLSADDFSRQPEVCLQLDQAVNTTGWRLPTLKELLTLVDFSAPFPTVFPAPALIDLTAFPDTPPSGFWSSTTTSNPLSPQLCAHFDGGQTVGCGTNNYIRCVR
jgi:hypothetical protein